MDASASTENASAHAAHKPAQKPHGFERSACATPPSQEGAGRGVVLLPRIADRPLHPFGNTMLQREPLVRDVDPHPLAVNNDHAVPPGT